MIVRHAGDRVQVITQPDHAQLAGSIMEHCTPLAGRSRRDTILRAIREHDAGWFEQDEAPRVNADTGEILDFIAIPRAIRQAVWPRTVGRLNDDPWAAALVAHHAVTVYDRFRSDPDWTSFFATMEAARDTRVRAAEYSFDDLVADYTFLRLADLISLAFCTGSTDPQRIAEFTIRLSGADVRVAPSAFGGSSIPIAIAAKELRSQHFQSDAELHAALRTADTITLRGTVS